MAKMFSHLFLFILGLSLFLKGSPVLAQEKTAQSSAIMISSQEIKDTRGERLREFFQSYQSPLAPYADFIVKTADDYSLDWKLVPAIAGVESTFGKFIPYNSFNAYGWNNGDFYFENWQEGIEVVSKNLKENYIDKWGAKTVGEIGAIYAPPSPFWAGRVAYFMGEIEAFEPSSLQFTL